MFCLQIHFSNCNFCFSFKNQNKYVMTSFFLFFNQNAYIELLLVNSKLTMRTIILIETNVVFINSHVFSCQSYIFCLFDWVFLSLSRIVHSYRDVTINGEGLQILMYARHSWSLSSEGSLACHAAFVYNFIFEDPRHSHILPSV